MRFLLLALLLCAACKHSSSSSSTSHTETQTTTDSTSSETGSQTTVTTTSEAPGKTVTVTEEYAPPTPQEEGPVTVPEDGGVIVQAAPEGRVHDVQQRQGPLIRRTTTTTEHGEKDTTARQEATQRAQGATETKAAGKVDTTAKAAEQSDPSAGCIGSSWLIGIGAILFAVALILGVLRFRKAV